MRSKDQLKGQVVVLHPSLSLSNMCSICYRFTEIKCINGPWVVKTCTCMFYVIIFHSFCILATFRITTYSHHTESQTEGRNEPFLEFTIYMFIFHILQYILTILKCIEHITDVYLRNNIIVLRIKSNKS